MRYRILSITLSLVFLLSPFAEGASPPKLMRPYAGIGLLQFSVGRSSLQELGMPLYREAGLSRESVLTDTATAGNSHIFGGSGELPPLIVSARKGDWYRVFYDDAGREAWIEPHKTARFVRWEEYLRQRPARLLPALPAHYYQLADYPDGAPLATLTPKQTFKVLKVDKCQCQVVTDRNQLGWLSWCDGDERLVVGF